MKKRLLPLILALVLCLGLAVPAMAAEATIEEVIPCELVNVGGFFEGLAWVEADANGKDQFGFMDKTGEIVIPAAYDDVYPFSEGLAAVQQNGKWGYIDQTGKMVISCKYDLAYSFSEGLALVVIDGNKGGYIDKTGKEVIPLQYAGANSFSDGLAVVEVNDKWGYIDQTGKEIIPFQYTAAYSFSEGLALVEKNGKLGYIDKTGEEVIPCQYNSAGGFYDGLASVQKQKDGKWGYIDQTGKEVVSFKYDNGANFYEGTAAVQQNNKWGFIDKAGKEIISCQYDDCWRFSSGFAPVKKDSKWGYIDLTGKEVVPFKYDNAGDFSDGMARVAQAHPVSGTDEVLYTYGFLAINEPAPEVTATVSDWAKEQVDAAAAAGLIAEGLGDDYTKNITRAQFAAVAVKLYEAMSGEAAPEAGETPFSDTSDPVVIQANLLGIVTGNEDGTFAPNDPVTREGAATMLSRVYTKLGGEIPQVEATSFADDGEMNGYAKSAVAFMAEKEIVGGVGDNRFDPQGKAAIEQALIIAMRMLENLK